jgi:hypothetical protein
MRFFLPKTIEIRYNCCYILVFCLMFCRSLFVLLVFVLSVLRFTASGYPFGIFKLYFLLGISHVNKTLNRKPRCNNSYIIMAILMRFFLPKTIEISLFSQLSKSKGFGFFYFLYLIALCSVTIRLLALPLEIQLSRGYDAINRFNTATFFGFPTSYVAVSFLCDQWVQLRWEVIVCTRLHIYSGVKWGSILIFTWDIPRRK